ncbi:MAG: beta-galactosidase [Clostridia bacterium]|nr:beta-galactosidase [Clostridia bacterium]
MEPTRYEINLAAFTPQKIQDLGDDFRGQSASGEKLSFNSAFMERNGTPFFGISGEFHYSRMHEARWEREIIKMRMGGINIVSTYLFWNHMEETEGVFDFTGSRDLRRFVELCRKHGLYVILRVGPFDHGEVRNGGLPDWLYGKPFAVRSTQEGFLHLVKRLYTEISRQVQGLFFRDGGPIIGIQLDNEYMHSAAPWEMTTGISNEWVPQGTEGEDYILRLRAMALECGLAPVFFTGTAWGGAAYSPRVLPLWGGYAYRPWIFYQHTGEHPATEEYVYEDYHHNGKTVADDFAPAYLPEERPYACCEMGAGMMCCYYYRFIYPYKSVDALANIKLGSGCNFLGYYMFQGGTNPLACNGTYLNESQVPKHSYDYQAALGEFGQIRESYQRLKALHFFTRFFGDRLAPMETVLPEGASQIDPRDTKTLRFAVRTDGESGFVFVNNFQDHLTLPDREGDTLCVRTRQNTFVFPIRLASEENAIYPFHFLMDGITLLSATATPLLRTVADGRITYVFLVPDGSEGTFVWENGTVSKPFSGSQDFSLATVTKGDVCIDVIRISRGMANQLYLLRDGSLLFTESALLEDENGALRLETTFPDGVLMTYPPKRLMQADGLMRDADRDGLGIYRYRIPARTIPVAVENTAPFRYTLSLRPEDLTGLWDVRLQIEYEGDIGHLFLGNTLVHDHFCNGDIWEFGLSEYRNQLDQPLCLVISPLREGAHVNVESGMAARSEEVRQIIGKLRSVRACPVYEIKL